MGKTPIAVEFGILVSRLRTEAALSQEEFAHRVGIHRTYAGAVERGEKTVTIETAQKLAKAVGISLSQMFILLEKARF